MSKSGYNIASIEKTNIVLTDKDKQLETLKKDLARQTKLVKKYQYLVSEFDKIPLKEPTRWEMIWTIIRTSYKIVRTLYFIFKILDLINTLKELKEMTKDKLTTIIGAVVGAIITILTIWGGYTIPAEVAQVIIGAIVAIVMWIWKPKG